MNMYQQKHLNAHSQETPALMRGECYRHLLWRDVAIHARRMSMKPKDGSKLGYDYIEGIGHVYRVEVDAMSHEKIIRCAHQNDADLIFMGSHTKEKYGNLRAGSAVKMVVQHSDSLVIVLSDADGFKP